MVWYPPRPRHGDRDGNLWVGTYGTGLLRLRQDTAGLGIVETFASDNPRGGLSGGIVYSLYEDRDANLWIGTEGTGLDRLRDSLITPFTTRDGLPHRRVTTVYEEPEGILWVGTEGGGLARLDNGVPPDHPLQHRSRSAAQAVDLGELAQEAAALVAGRINEKRIKVVISPDLPIVSGDRSRLLAVLQNLIDNATKYTGSQGQPRVEIGVRQDSDEPVFFVADNGLGIDAQYQQKVFGLFERLDTKSEGSGVGLAAVKRIIEIHGGRIWVESDGLEKGSTFCFTLPHPGGLGEEAPE